MTRMEGVTSLNEGTNLAVKTVFHTRNGSITTATRNIRRETAPISGKISIFASVQEETLHTGKVNSPGTVELIGRIISRTRMGTTEMAMQTVPESHADSSRQILEDRRRRRCAKSPSGQGRSDKGQETIGILRNQGSISAGVEVHGDLTCPCAIVMQHLYVQTWGATSMGL